MENEAVIRVTIAWSLKARVVHEVQIELPAGSDVAAALRVGQLNADPVHVGVWGKTVSLDAPVRDGDRIEVYRPLTVDPKIARRERFRKQGSKGTGLFANKRAGAKAGY